MKGLVLVCGSTRISLLTASFTLRAQLKGLIAFPNPVVVDQNGLIVIVIVIAIVIVIVIVPDSYSHSPALAQSNDLNCLLE